MRPPTHRSERRLAAQITVYAKIGEDSDSQFFADVVGRWDGGVFIATAARVPIDAVVAVELTVPWAPESILRTIGRVEWRRDPARGVAPGVGVRMTDISDDERREIEHYCRTRPPMTPEAGDVEIESSRRIG
jgi:hypothetical protein